MSVILAGSYISTGMLFEQGAYRISTFIKEVWPHDTNLVEGGESDLLHKL